MVIKPTGNLGEDISSIIALIITFLIKVLVIWGCWRMVSPTFLSEVPSLYTKIAYWDAVMVLFLLECVQEYVKGFIPRASV